MLKFQPENHQNDPLRKQKCHLFSRYLKQIAQNGQKWAKIMNFCEKYPVFSVMKPKKCNDHVKYNFSFPLSTHGNIIIRIDVNWFYFLVILDLHPGPFILSPILNQNFLKKAPHSNVYKKFWWHRIFWYFY